MTEFERIITGKRKSPHNIQSDILSVMALQNESLAVTDVEVLEHDITEVFYAYLIDKIENKEKIDIQLLGEVSNGKSTVAMAIQKIVQDYLEETERSKKVNRINLIYGNINEAIRGQRKLSDHKCIVIDEYNTLSNTGDNSTTENAEFVTRSDIHAQKFHHTIGCSPGTVTSPNATVVLTVIGRDLTKKITRCRLDYRTRVNIVPLGAVDINVSEIVNSELEKKYRRIKIKRWELLDTYNARDIRELERADTIIYVVNKMMPSIGKRSTSIGTRCKGLVRARHRQIGRLSSWLDIAEITQDAQGILEMVKEEAKTRHLLKDDKVEQEDREKLEQELESLSDNIKTLYQDQLRLVEAYEEYNKIREEVVNNG